MAGLELLKQVFGEEWFNKFAKVKGLALPKEEAIKLAKEYKSKLPHVYPCITIESGEYSGLTIALIEVPSAWENFKKETKLGNLKVGVLIGNVWGSIFYSKEQAEEFEQALQNNQFLIVILRNYRTRETPSGSESWTANLVQFVELAQLIE